MTGFVQRVNFVERAPLVLSYRHLLLAGSVMVVLMAGYYGLQLMRLRWTDRNIAAMRLEVTRLNTEKQMRMKREEAVTGTAAVVARKALIRELEEAPSWSAILRDLTIRTPNALWLTRLQSAPKKDAEEGRQLSLEGIADEPSAIAQFIQDLSSSPRFREVILKNSQQEKDAKGVRYSFGIEMKVVVSGGGL